MKEINNQEQETQSNYDFSVIKNENLKNLDKFIEEKLNYVNYLLMKDKINIEEEIVVRNLLSNKAKEIRRLFEKNLNDICQNKENSKKDIEELSDEELKKTKQNIDLCIDKAIFKLKGNNSEIGISSESNSSSNKQPSWLKFVVLSIVLTSASYYALFIVDNINHKANEQEKKIVACEKEKEKEKKNSNFDCLENTSQMYRNLSNEKSSQSVALKSLAMSFNILFVLGLSGLFIVVLKVFGKVFGLEVADKMLEKLLDGIEKKSITGDSGTSPASILSTVFSGHALIGVSVAATMGVAVVNTSQQSTYTSNNNIFNNQEYVKNKLNAVDEIKSLIDEGLKPLPKEINEIKQLIELHNNKELPEGVAGIPTNSQLEEIKRMLDKIIKIDGLSSADELKLLSKEFDVIKELIKVIADKNRVNDSVNSQLAEIKRKLDSIDNQSQLKEMKKILNEYYGNICNDLGLKPDEECRSF